MAAVTPMTAAVPGARTAPDAASGHRTDAERLVEGLRRPRPVVLVDVRTPAEYETAHVEGAVNVPLDLLLREPGAVASRLSGDVVLMCALGGRAEQAREALVAAGATATLQVLGGGVDGVRRAGGTVVAGRSRWAMERQVRLVAGSLVLGSVLLSLQVPAARFLAGGVGAGLTYAALSDTCTMARGLARLPYNRTVAAPTLDEVLAQLDAA
ncbi:rhodanese-like domain-containing protein [Pseudokineococcus sp. 5B2Z-1]|uniref:rhodanese-like domain-containing protein n=1 Tax=Pseudokineococcus sp. 5B2Z-1 TaxID=3132744 RepID=UPI003094ED90